jgi:copper chaperone
MIMSTTTSSSRVILTVPDISCGHCEATVKQALLPLAGVRAVSVDLPTKAVTVDYDAGQVDLDRLKVVLAEEDYPVATARSLA